MNKLHFYKKIRDLNILVLLSFLFCGIIVESHSQELYNYQPIPYQERIIDVQPNEEMKLLFDGLIPGVSLSWRANELIMGMGLGILEGRFPDTTSIYPLPSMLNYMLFDLELLKKIKRKYSDNQLIKLYVYLYFLQTSSERVIKIPKSIEIKKTSSSYPYMENYCCPGDLQYFNYKVIVEFDLIDGINICKRAEMYFRIIRKEIISCYGDIEYTDGKHIISQCGGLRTIQSLSKVNLEDYIQSRKSIYRTKK